MLAAECIPIIWYGNEIVYFDLAHATVRPDLFGPQHSTVDGSNARFLSFAAIGTLIDAVGFHTAKVILNGAFYVLFAFVLAWLFQTMRIGTAAAALGLVIFVAANQSLLGGEWILGTTEPKTFAYLCVFAGLALAFGGRWWAALLLTGAGTYFHFLVGGFWGLTVVLLHLVQTGRWGRSAILLAFFAVLSLPMFLLLLGEQLAAAPDMTGIDLTLREINTVFRNPHHLAPFTDLSVFRANWLSGLLIHVCFAVFFIWIARSGRYPVRGTALWLALLNSYILLAVILSFLDRAYILAPLYLFRPASLLLLLTIVAGLQTLLLAVSQAWRPKIALVATGLAVVIALPTAVPGLGRYILKNTPIETRLTPEARDLIEWIQRETDADDAIAMQPPLAQPSLAEGDLPYGVMERLTGRGFIVNFKLMPSTPELIVRWYRLLEARTRLFEGDCTQITALEADWIVAMRAESPSAVVACGVPVYENDRYTVLRPGT
ncbi:MAG: hypothetical protein AAF376_03980 [Pseudomonadota bacterium]